VARADSRRERLLAEVRPADLDHEQRDRDREHGIMNASTRVLGGGARLFDGVGPDLKLEHVRAIEAPAVTQLKYRVDTRVPRWPGDPMTAERRASEPPAVPGALFEHPGIDRVVHADSPSGGIRAPHRLLSRVSGSWKQKSRNG
jgi:hypothetical protein